MRFSFSRSDAYSQGMKEYNVDLVMMNGGDIRGLDEWSWERPLSHENFGHRFVG